MSFFKTILLSIVFLIMTDAQQLKRLVNLSGRWSFSIGDNLKWKQVNFDDSDWDRIKVPASWENEGYNGYDGFAWYRTGFIYGEDLQNKELWLKLGNIDDVDEVYINGNLVGRTGSFPPDYCTGYYDVRQYYIPNKLLIKNKENVIAVRVFDDRLEGGIRHNDIGIYENTDKVKMDINLTGIWSFKTGDDMNYVKPDWNDKSWDSVYVPMYWEKFGYTDYDGFAWYRKDFYLSDSYKNDQLILLLGKIDDIDEVYFNGTKISYTNDFSRIEDNFESRWQQFRYYSIPEKLIKYGSQNLISVRVYDSFRDGGIFEGPIGIIRSKKLNEFIKTKENKKKNIWEFLFGR